MKRVLSATAWILSAVCFIMMFFVDGSIALLDMTNSYIWILDILSIVFMTIAVKKGRSGRLPKEIVWSVLFLIIFLCAEPAKYFHQRNTIETPGTELRSPPLGYIISEGEKKQILRGDYKWQCGKDHTENYFGFNEWVRIGFPESAEFTESDNVILYFSSYPDELDVRYWDHVDWEWPSEIGKKIKLDEEYGFAVQKGLYRIDCKWYDYGVAEYCFEVK